MRLLTTHRWASLAIAAALFGSIFAARAAIGTLGVAISFLYIVPVVLVAVSHGTRGGLAAGAVAFGLSSVGVVLGDLPASPLGYFNRALVYLFVGGLTGRFATTLRALEAESARHFDLSLDMICIAGFDGRFKRVNPAFERTLGYSEQELLSRPFVEFVHPEDRRSTEAEAAAIGDGNGVSQFQNRYFDRAGNVHWLEWSSKPLLDEGLIYAVARDVTDRKALEHELERLSQHDSLTGLFNRRRFEQELERQLAYTRRYGTGGALLLPEVDEEGALAVAERLTAALAAAEPSYEGRALNLSMSIGIACFDAHGCPPADDLVAAADRAMYDAKAGGGGAVALAPATAGDGAKPGAGLL